MHPCVGMVALSSRWWERKTVAVLSLFASRQLFGYHAIVMQQDVMFKCVYECEYVQLCVCVQCANRPKRDYKAQLQRKRRVSLHKGLSFFHLHQIIAFTVGPRYLRYPSWYFPGIWIRSANALLFTSKLRLCSLQSIHSISASMYLPNQPTSFKRNLTTSI